MDFTELEKLGLNKNESKVYFALLSKGQASAAELVKFLGVHRNIVYDNVEKLIEKGLASYIVEGTKKKFIAENPESILEFLDYKKEQLDRETKLAEDLIPQIKKIMSVNKKTQDASLFRGAKGIKKILNEILHVKEYWVIGVSNDSVRMLGETFWTNFNLRRADKKVREHLLFNADFDNVVSIRPGKLSEFRVLPSELNQATEIMIFDDKIAILVYTEEPIGLLIENSEIFNTFRKQFDFLWNLSRKK